MATATLSTYIPERSIRPSRPASIVPLRPCRAPRTPYTAVFKRTLDIFIASLLIVLLLSWMTPLLFVLIRLGSKGPLFFIQQRSGRGGRLFPCIKFRTMRLNADADRMQAQTDDDRITGIGHFLRSTHIDELPQLFNVLLNHMSLVGPRPHMLYHDVVFAGLLPQYPLRQLVKPGITGLAQSAGYFGATPDFRSISCRTRLDLFYVKHTSLRLDMCILLKTFSVLLFDRRKKAEA